MVAFNFNYFGVLEYWSNDERIDVFFFQHSIPSKAETFKNRWQTLNYLFIGYNSVIF